MSGYEVVSVTNSAIPSSSFPQQVVALCSAGKKPVGGGYSGHVGTGLSGTPLRVLGSIPHGGTTPTGWRVKIDTFGEVGTSTLTVYAICVSVAN